MEIYKKCVCTFQSSTILNQKCFIRTKTKNLIQSTMCILTFQSTKSKWFHKKHKKIFENSNNSINAPTYLIILYVTEDIY